MKRLLKLLFGGRRAHLPGTVHLRDIIIQLFEEKFVVHNSL